MQLSSERKRAEEKEKRCNVPDVTFVDDVQKFSEAEQNSRTRRK